MINKNALGWLKNNTSTKNVLKIMSDALLAIAQQAELKNEVDCIEYVVECMNLCDNRPALRYFSIVKQMLLAELEEYDVK